MYLVHHPDNKPAPALSSRARPYVQVHAETIWKLLEESRSAGCILSTFVATKTGGSHVGCSRNRAIDWMGKYHSMYCDRREYGFRYVSHFSERLWLSLTSFITISFILTLIIFIGEGIRDSYNPDK